MSGRPANWPPPRRCRGLLIKLTQRLKVRFYLMGPKQKIFWGLFIIICARVVFSFEGEILQPKRFIESPNLPYDSISSSDDITSLYFNPAGLAVHPLQIGYFYGDNREEYLRDNVLFMNFYGLAFSTQWRRAPEKYYATRYTAGTGLGGTSSFKVGTSYSWFKSNVPILDEYTQWDLGFIWRPYRWISVGGVFRSLNKRKLEIDFLSRRFEFGLGFRPIPDYDNLTVSIDTTMHEGKSLKKLLPRYGVEIASSSGTSLYGGWDNYSNFFFGFKFSQHVSQLSMQGNFRKEEGNFYSGGILIGQERFTTSIEAISSYLEIPLDIEFKEEKKAGFLFGGSLAFYEILNAIKIAENDAQIKGILITGRKFKGGWGQAEELRNALKRFKTKSKKPVLAFLEYAANKEYYIASVADEISMPLAGGLEVTGLKADLLFVKDLLEKVGVKADFIHVGDYKSAPEMYERSDPTKYSKEQTLKLLENLDNEIKTAILSDRKKIKKDNIEKYFNTGIFSAKKALEYGFIDNIEYYSDTARKIMGNISSSYRRKISIPDYVSINFYDDRWGVRPIVAIVVIEGDIVSGKSTEAGIFSEASVGSDSVVKVINNLKVDSDVKAVVIRINSPGGSGIASDVIWKEISLLKEKKPVVISFADVAASGGYYIALAGGEIVSNKNAITGSVGVYTGKFSLKKLYQMIGVNKTVLSKNKKSAIFSETDEYTKEERDILYEHLYEFYEIFLNRVKQHRKDLTIEKVEQNARGRVFSGSEAEKNGMIDKTGGLMLALELARIKAGISAEDVQVLFVPKVESSLIELKNYDKIFIPHVLQKALRVWQSVDEVKDDKIFFMMPYDINIE